MDRPSIDARSESLQTPRPLPPPPSNVPNLIDAANNEVKAAEQICRGPSGCLGLGLGLGLRGSTRRSSRLRGFKINLGKQDAARVDLGTSGKVVPRITKAHDGANAGVEFNLHAHKQTHKKGSLSTRKNRRSGAQVRRPSQSKGALDGARTDGRTDLNVVDGIRNERFEEMGEDVNGFNCSAQNRTALGRTVLALDLPRGHFVDPGLCTEE